MLGKDEKTAISIYDLVLLGTGIISAISMITIILRIFSPLLVITASFIIIAALLYGFKLIPTKPARNVTAAFIIILVLGILLRMDIYPHYIGGQDQGLYVNYAQTMLRTGSLNFTDDFRENMPENIQSIYDKATYLSVGMTNQQPSEYTIEFYPLHPIWMAIAQWIFGFGKHTLSLLFFSILLMIGVYRLTFEIKGSERASLIALGISATNPALVFFSKFPVTEIMASALLFNAFYLWLKSWRERENIKLCIFCLIAALLLINAFLYTRMSFFILLPLMLIILLTTYLVHWDNKIYKKSTQRFVYCTIALFILSMIYYNYNQHSLFAAMFEFAFKASLLRNIKLIIGGLIITLVALGYLYSIRKKTQVIKIVIEKYERYALPVFCLALIGSVYFILKLYITGDLAPFHYIIPQNLYMFHYSTLYRLFQIASPFLLIFLFIGIFPKLVFNEVESLLIMFGTFVWLEILMWSPNIPYLYYYGRYIVSEMLPVLIILFAIVFDKFLHQGKAWKNVSYIFLGLIISYNLVFSFLQVGKLECEKGTFFNEVNYIVNNNDVIFGSESEVSNRIAVPVRIAFEKKLFLFKPNESIETTKSIIDYYLQEGIGNTYYISLQGRCSLEKYYNCELVKTINYTNDYFTNSEHAFGSGVYNNKYPLASLLLPFKNISHTQVFYLYKLEDKITKKTSAQTIDFTPKGNSNLYIDKGWGDQEESFHWTVNEKATLSIPITDLYTTTPFTKVEFTMFAYTGLMESQRVIIKIGEQNATEIAVGREGKTYSVDISPDTLSNKQELNIELYLPDCHSPYAAGQSADSRNLGVAVKTIVFK
jgi:hypothetical protein